MVLSKLKEAMEVKKVTETELAAKVMLTTRSIQNAMNKKGVTLNTAKRIASGMRINLEQLI